jgi:hypothetical protein
VKISAAGFVIASVAGFHFEGDARNISVAVSENIQVSAFGFRFRVVGATDELGSFLHWISRRAANHPASLRFLLALPAISTEITLLRKNSTK